MTEEEGILKDSWDKLQSLREEFDPVYLSVHCVKW